MKSRFIHHIDNAGENGGEIFPNIGAIVYKHNARICGETAWKNSRFFLKKSVSEVVKAKVYNII